MAKITWNDLTADEQEALKNVDTFGVITSECMKSLKDKMLIIVGRRKIEMTTAGRAVLAQATTAAAKTVKLRVPSADGLYWEVLYTDGTWEGEATSEQ